MLIVKQNLLMILCDNNLENIKLDKPKKNIIKFFNGLKGDIVVDCKQLDKNTIKVKRHI